MASIVSLGGVVVLLYQGGGFGCVSLNLFGILSQMYGEGAFGIESRHLQKCFHSFSIDSITIGSGISSCVISINISSGFSLSIISINLGSGPARAAAERLLVAVFMFAERTLGIVIVEWNDDANEGY